CQARPCLPRCKGRSTMHTTTRRSASWVCSTASRNAPSCWRGGCRACTSTRSTGGGPRWRSSPPCAASSSSRRSTLRFLPIYGEVARNAPEGLSPRLLPIHREVARNAPEGLSPRLLPIHGEVARNAPEGLTQDSYFDRTDMPLNGPEKEVTPTNRVLPSRAS